MPNSKPPWYIFKLNLNIYLNICLLSDLPDDECCWKSDHTEFGPARLYIGQVWPRNTEINKSTLPKCAWLEIHGLSHGSHAQLLNQI